MTDQVYFIQDVSGKGPVKIGYSSDVAKRLNGLRTASATDLRIVALVDGDRRQEAAFHERFATYRLHGEWFEMHGALAEFIASPAPMTLDEQPTTTMGDFIRDWGIGQFASDLGIPYFHANTMLRRNSIPVEYWPLVIAAAAARGTPMDANDLLAMVTRQPASIGRRAAA
jgi:hypothetical protein